MKTVRWGACGVLLKLALVAGCSSGDDEPAPVGGADVAPVTDSGAADTGPQATDTGPQDAATAADTTAAQDMGAPSDLSAAGVDVPIIDAGPPKDPGPTLTEDAGPQGPFTWIRITDDPTNKSLDSCLPTNTPGADIDAVALVRAGEIVGYATQVAADLNKDVNQKGEPCTNDYQDASEAEGEPDATFQTGSVSLNGGSIMLQVADGAQIMSGDVIRVFEVGAAAVGVPEKYSVAIGAAGNIGGSWLIIEKGLEGEDEALVSF